MPNPDLPKRENLVIEINGIYEPVRYDAMTGECYESVYFHKEGKTVIRQTVYLFLRKSGIWISFSWILLSGVLSLLRPGAAGAGFTEGLGWL